MIYLLMFVSFLLADFVYGRQLGDESLVERPQQIAVRSGAVELKGQWLLFQGRFIAPSDILSHKVNFAEAEPITLPGNLPKKDHKNGQYGTLVLKVSISGSLRKLGIRGPLVTDSYSLYFFSEKSEGLIEPLFSSGRVSSRKDEAIPWASRPISGLEILDPGEYFVLIHFSNHDNAYHFVSEVPILGSQAKVFQIYVRERIFSFFLLGAFFLTVIYNISLFLQRTEDKGSLWLAFLSVIFGIRYFLTERLLEYFYTEPSAIVFELSIRAQIVSVALAFLCYVSFLRYNYMSLLTKRYTVFVRYYAFAASLIIGSVAYGNLAISMAPLALLLLALSVPLFLGLIRAIRYRYSGSGYLLISFVILSLSFMTTWSSRRSTRRHICFIMR